jgi:hypothetical protein
MQRILNILALAGLGATRGRSHAHASCRLRHAPGAHRSERALFRHLRLRRLESAVCLQLLSHQARQRIHDVGYRSLDDHPRLCAKDEHRRSAREGQRQARANQVRRHQPLSSGSYGTGCVVPAGAAPDRSTAAAKSSRLSTTRTCSATAQC